MSNFSESFKRKKPFYITLIITGALALIFILAGAISAIIEESDDNSSSSSSKYSSSSSSSSSSTNTSATLTIDNEYSAKSGKTTFTFKTKSSGYHYIYISDIYDVSTIGLKKGTTTINMTASKANGYYKCNLTADTTYTLVIDADSSYDIMISK